MKTLIKLLLIVFLMSGICSCDIQKEASKQKNDIDFTERIETKEIRKGDTVTYIVPIIKYKDTIITTISRQGTILKTYYDNKGNISQSECIGAEIDILRNEIRTLNDQSKTKEKTKEESYFNNPLLWMIIALAVIVLLKK